MSALPLLIRTGARYACHGDGLCCTDAHALGPVTPDEETFLDTVAKSATREHSRLSMRVLRTTESHACIFLEADGRCGIHARFGEARKPVPCRRFPLGLVLTPAGGRVTTEHRCPCRTLGDSPLLTEDIARNALVDTHGALDADVTVTDEIALDDKQAISFAEYESSEATIRNELRAGVAIETALSASPFPALDGLTFADLGHHFRGLLDGSVCGDALAMFGDALLTLCTDYTPSPRARTWTAAFERAESRSPVTKSDISILADFVEDQLWSMSFYPHATWSQGRAELATRARIAEHLASAFAKRGTRSDRAMAEAILVVELAGASSLWRSITSQMVIP